MEKYINAVLRWRDICNRLDVCCEYTFEKLYREALVWEVLSKTTSVKGRVKCLENIYSCVVEKKSRKTQAYDIWLEFLNGRPLPFEQRAWLSAMEALASGIADEKSQKTAHHNAMKQFVKILNKTFHYKKGGLKVNHPCFEEILI